MNYKIFSISAILLISILSFVCATQYDSVTQGVVNEDGVTTSQYIGNFYTALNSTNITLIRLKLNKVGSPNYNVSVYTSNSSGSLTTLLCMNKTTNINGIPESPSSAWITITGCNYTQIKGSNYTIVLRGANADPPKLNWLSNDTATGYKQLYSTDKGVTWSIVDGTAQGFALYETIIGNVGIDIYNLSTYETELQYFRTKNISNSSTISNPQFNYDGVNYTASLNTLTGNYTLSTSKYIPSGSIGAFYFSWYNGSKYLYSDELFQSVTAIDLSLCGVTGNVPFINFTFVNENTLTNLNSTLNTNFYYYLSNPISNKTYSYIQTSEYPSYAFCFSPPDKNIYSTYDVQFSASGYPTRRFSISPTLFTNTTTNKILYMLASADGIYSTIVTSSIANVPISGVLLQIERQIGGVWYMLEQGTSDSAGSSTFWVNPNYDHRITASKTGYTTTQVTIRPSSSQYTILMGTSSNATYVNTLEGVNYWIYPKSGFINSNTTYQFSLNISSTLGNLAKYKIELSNKTNGILNYTEATNPYGSNISVWYNTGDIPTIYAKYYVSLDGTNYYLFDPTIYSVRNITTGGSSIYQGLQNLLNYEANPEDNYARLWFFFFLLFLILSIFTFATGVDVGQNAGIIIIPIIFIVFIFSFTGFFTIDFVPSLFMSKWGVFLLVLLYGGGYLLGRFAQT